MNTTFSDYTRFFLQNYGEIRCAHIRVFQEFERILMDVENALRDRNWQSRRSAVWDQPRSQYLQLFKPHWPSPAERRVHLEIGIDELSLFNHEIYFGLDVEGEGDWVWRRRFQASLDRLFQRYDHAISTSCPGSYSPRSNCRAFSYTIAGLPEVSSEKLKDDAGRLLLLASFVDEALFLADKKCLWRTDFINEQDDTSLSLEWCWMPAKYAKHGYEGGQSIQNGIGRFGTACLRIDGTQGNYGPILEGRSTRNICRLALGHAIRGYRGGRDIYLSCIVRAKTGGAMSLCATARPRRISKHWSPCHPEDAADPLLRITVSASDEWQHVKGEGKLPAVRGHNPAPQGFDLCLISETADPEWCVDSIECGVKIVGADCGRQ